MSKEDALRDLGIALHQRLATGADDVVTSQIAETFLPFVVGSLDRKYRTLTDPHLTTMAAIDALLRYFDKPQRFDPDKASLFFYLRMSAEGDLLNMLEKEHGREAKERVVELRSRTPEYISEKDVEAELAAMAPGETSFSPLMRQVETIVPDATDRKIVSLMMDGVRETSAYAEVLGISSLSGPEQARTVKRHKDRLKKALQRGIKRK